MEKPEFKGGVLGGYKKEEVDSFITQLINEYQNLQQEKEKLEEERDRAKKKLLEIEGHYRNLWEAYQESEEKNEEMSKRLEGIDEEQRDLHGKINALESANELVRKKYVDREMGIPNEFEKQMKRKFVEEEFEIDESIIPQAIPVQFETPTTAKKPLLQPDELLNKAERLLYNAPLHENTETNTGVQPDNEAPVLAMPAEPKQPEMDMPINTEGRATGQGRPTPTAQARPEQTVQARPVLNIQGRPNQTAQARPAQASQARPAQASQARPAQASQARPAQASQTRPDQMAQARTAADARAAMGTPNNRTGARPNQNMNLQQSAVEEMQRKAREKLSKFSDSIDSLEAKNKSATMPNGRRNPNPSANANGVNPLNKRKSIDFNNSAPTGSGSLRGTANPRMGLDLSGGDKGVSLRNPSLHKESSQRQLKRTTMNGVVHSIRKGPSANTNKSGTGR